MVSIASKPPTSRTAVATCIVQFSNPTAATLIRENRAKKGDVLGVARIAGIMAAKQTPTLIPLCHPIPITHVSIDIDLAQPQPETAPSFSSLPTSTSLTGTGQDSQSMGDEANESSTPGSENGHVNIIATVSCDGKTGVEMEALTAAATAALTVYDMCKAVDKGMRIEGLRVVRKEGGASGTWVDGESVSS